MSKVHEEAARLLESLLRENPEDEPVSSRQIDQALERIEELSKEVQTDDDDAYLESVAETMLGLRAHARGHAESNQE